MESCIVFSIGIEIAVANRDSHSLQLAPQFCSFALQRGGGSAPGNFFQTCSDLIGILHFLGFWGLNDRREISRKLSHSDGLKFSKGFQNRLFVESILRG